MRFLARLRDVTLRRLGRLALQYQYKTWTYVITFQKLVCPRKKMESIICSLDTMLLLKICAVTKHNLKQKSTLYVNKCLETRQDGFAKNFHPYFFQYQNYVPAWVFKVLQVTYIILLSTELPTCSSVSQQIRVLPLFETYSIVYVM